MVHYGKKVPFSNGILLNDMILLTISFHKYAVYIVNMLGSKKEIKHNRN